MPTLTQRWMRTEKGPASTDKGPRSVPEGEVPMAAAPDHPVFFRLLLCMTLVLFLAGLMLLLSSALADTAATCCGAAAQATQLRAEGDFTARVPARPDEWRARLLLAQWGCAALLVALIAAVVRGGWIALVRRPAMAGLGAHAGATGPGGDEIGRLLFTIADLEARLDSREVESSTHKRALAEQTRHHVESLLCLHEIVDRLLGAPISDFTLRKAISMLSDKLGTANAALRLSSQLSSALRCKSLIALHGIPTVLTQPFEEGALATHVGTYPNSRGESSRCLNVALRHSGETIGMLTVEAAESYCFDEARIRLTQTAAMLMTMALSVASQGQEERRGALLAERAAIARELHDSLAQSLAFLKIQVARLQVILRDAPISDAGGQLAAQLREGITSAYRQVKELISAFRVSMDSRGLEQALEEAVEEFGLKGGLSVALDFRLLDCRLTINEEFHVLQVIREALSNTVRHARASHVSVALFQAEADDHVVATVEDDGRGFDPALDRPMHYGLSIMRERAASLGGQLVVVQPPGGGTIVRLTFAPQSIGPERPAGAWL